MFPSPREEMNISGDHLREGSAEDALGCFSCDLEGQSRSLQKMGVARVHHPKQSSEQFTKLIASQFTEDLCKPRI